MDVGARMSPFPAVALIQRPPPKYLDFWSNLDPHDLIMDKLAGYVTTSTGPADIVYPGLSAPHIKMETATYPDFKL